MVNLQQQNVTGNGDGSSWGKCGCGAPGHIEGQVGWPRQEGGPLPVLWALHPGLGDQAYPDRADHPYTCYRRLLRKEVIEYRAEPYSLSEGCLDDLMVLRTAGFGVSMTGGRHGATISIVISEPVLGRT